MKYMLGWMLLLPMMAAGQLYDDFSDGNLHADPIWHGDTHLFEVNTASELWLNAPAVSGSAYLSTPSSAVDTASWSIDVRMAFNPSSSNYADIVLMSDSADLSTAFHGYFIRLGGASDEVSLWRKDGEQTVELIDGFDDILDESAVEVRVHVERSNSGEWQLWADTGSIGNFVLQGNAVDETYTSSAYFGVKTSYTSTRSDKFFFDNISVTGAAYADTLAPQSELVHAVFEDSLCLRFSEPISPEVLQCTSCFQAGRGERQPNALRFKAASEQELILGFEMGFKEGQRLPLRIIGVADHAGNTDTLRSSFTFYQNAAIEPGDLIIHEFMADPEPPLGLPNAEYVELFNRSDRFIALDGLELSDASSTGTYRGSFVLPPAGYVILCARDDSASLASFGRVCALDGMPTLNNSSDSLRISLGGVVLDELGYDRSWYRNDTKDDGGYSLERIQPDHPCSGAFNWMASADVRGGTPGAQNSVHDDRADRFGPRVTAVEITDAQTVRIQTDEALSSNAFEQVFRIDSLGWVDSVSYHSGETQVSLHLNQALVKGLPYTLEVTELRDCFLNRSDTSIRIAIGLPASLHDLVFSELRPVPAAGALPPAEYVELYNRTDFVLTTHGLRVSDASSGSDLPNALIWPRQHVLLVDDGDANAFEAVNTLALGTLPSLNNTEDHLYLHRYDTLIDAVHYSADWFHPERPTAEGWSLERTSMNDLCGTHRNWTSSASPDQGTPGLPNSLEETDVSEESELHLYVSSPTEVRLRLEEQIDTSAARLALIDGRIHSTELGDAPDEIRVLLSDSLSMGKTIEVSLTAVRCDSVLIDKQASTYLPKPTDVVINEVLFNPRGDGSDYVELYNRSVFPIDLSGWSLPKWVDDSLAQDHLLSDTQLLLLPDGYLAFTEDREDVRSNYPFSPIERLRSVVLPSYPNDAGTVMLSTPWGLTIDRFDYDASMHFELLDDPDGVALERIHPDLPSNDPSAWTSAASSDNHGTPGYENSQLAALSESGSVVSLSQQSLSPDGDGFEDVLLVEYALSSPEAQLNAQVFSDEGVLVHRIASNLLVGRAGALAWDGVLEDGRRAPTGIHILLVDVFHLNGGSERYKLPFAVRYAR